VLLSGQDLTGLSNSEMSHLRLTTMGFVFQQAYLLPNLSLRDNILLPVLKAFPESRDAARKRVDQLMERFDIEHVATHGVTEVSGGQLQRAALCRAIATEPKILFADEPTGALNSTVTREVMKALNDINVEGTTIVMVTHDPACAVLADRVVYLRDGALAGEHNLGAWDSEDTGRRQEDLQNWLKGLGF
jgi:ABC transporter related protein